jgi:gluconokinase
VIVVVMGVSASGKSTVGEALADRLGAEFLEGDDLHPQANVAKMRRGEPLDDTDRGPWLDRLHAAIAERVAAGKDTVVASSALKRRYRDRLREGLPPGTLRFVHLDVDRATLLDRLARRKDHFMPPSLLDSQLADLELPTEDEAATVVDATRPADRIVEDVVAQARRWRPPET